MMEKRKRRAYDTKTPNPSPDRNPHSSQIDSLSDQVSQVHSFPNLQEPNCSHGIVEKNPRHHYSRKRRSNHGDTSAFTGKVTRQQGEKLSFKLSSKPHPDSAGQITVLSENKDKLSCQPEKIRDSLLTKDGSSSDMVCGLCEKRLRKKPNISNHSSSSGEVLVVAVLVCGHVYHGDCLEQGTCREDLQDPPCPLCPPPLRDEDASLVHE